MRLTRRAFIKSGGVAMLGFGALPSFLTRAIATTSTANGKVLVIIFQRGASDGLNTVVPFAEAEYYRLRPTIAIPQPSRGRNETAIDLDGFFALHPALAPLAPIYRQGQLAIVHAAGSPDNTRSHFDAQDYMDSGTPGVRSTSDGWLNRHLQVVQDANTTPFRAVSVGQTLPRALQGRAPAVALANAQQFRVMAPSPVASAGFEALYTNSSNRLLSGPGRETFEAIEMLQRADIVRFQPEHGAEYPRSRFGQSLLLLAQFIKSNIGLEAGFIESGGWDHHTSEGGTQGRLALLLRDLGNGLAAFHRDLGDRMQQVVVVTMSEFGRTAQENGNRGTDHGHANCMFVMGGPIRGGKVLGAWPGLQRGQLYEGRDLALTSDFRTVLGELIERHLGDRQLDVIFPSFHNDRRKFLGLV